MQLHPGARWLFRASVLILGIIILLFSYFFLKSFGKPILSSLIAILLVIIILAEIYSRLAYKNWKYELTNTEIKIEEGIIWKSYVSIPYQRVQNVNISRGILARLIGFSTLQIHTAGYSAVQTRYGNVNIAEGNLPAVEIEDAEKIRKFIMQKIDKKSIP